MLDDALKKQKNEICDSINTKLHEQASEINKLQKATEQNTKVVNNLKSELDILRQDHHEKLDLLNSSVSLQNKELCEIKKNIEGMKCDIANLKTEKSKLQLKQIDQEARSRRDNLIFYGIREEKDENVNEVICSFLREKLQISDGTTIIDRAHRLGRPKPGVFLGKEKPRPIIVKFYRFKEKERVRSMRSDLSAPYSISEDIPIEIREARKSLHPQFQELKNQNKRPYIIYPAILMCDGKQMAKADPLKHIAPART